MPPPSAGWAPLTSKKAACLAKAKVVGGVMHGRNSAHDPAFSQFMGLMGLVKRDQAWLIFPLTWYFFSR